MHLVLVAPQNRYTTLSTLHLVRPAVMRNLEAFGHLLETDLDAAIDAEPSATLLAEHFNEDVAEAMALPGDRMLAVEPVTLPVLA